MREKILRDLASRAATDLAFLRQARQDLQGTLTRHGYHLTDEERSGRFSHESVRGEYRMVGQRVVVTITEEHWLLPWPVAEVSLRELLASA